MEIKTTEFFKNIKKLPPPGTDEFKQLIDWEEAKIKGGVTINGVFFPPWLYWHLNHWMIRIDAVDEWGNDARVPSLPILRDNEWIRAEEIEKAKQSKQGYIEVGLRQGGKSEMEASYLGMNATMFRNTQNVMLCGNDADLSLLKDKVDFGLKNIWSGLSIPRLDKTWRLDQIRLGYKKQDGDDDIWSYIIVRNAVDGRNTEAAAGTTAKTFIIDEIGKFSFAAAFKAGEPAMKGPNGFRDVPILVGCLTEGNHVFTNTGNLIDIKDLKKEQGIIGFDKETQNVSLEDIIHINPPQKKECYEIYTNKGTRIECSYDHPILIKHRNKLETINKKRRRKLDFIEAKDIKEGMSLAIPDIIPLMGDRKMENPYFIGVLIGDGNYSSDRGIRFYNEDQEIWDYINDINKDYTIFKSYITDKRRLYREARFRGGMKQLKEIGIYGQSKENKDLPKDIHLYREQDVCELIAGLFDTDGCVVADGDKNNYIFLSSTSKKLIESLKFLLIRLGIHSDINFRKPDTRDRKIKGKNGYYELYILDKKSVLRFIEKIPLKIKRKKERLDILKNIFNNRKSKTDSNYETLRFEKIVTITFTGLKDVYNLTTNNTHTYIANGIITHNTGGAFEKGKDAENFFYNPDSHKFRRIFLSGLHRLDCKEETTLDKWLQEERGMVLKETDELSKITILVSNKEKAKTTIELERAEAKSNPDRTLYLKQKMYYPLEVDECFLRNTYNIFDVESAKRQQQRIHTSGRTGVPVILLHDGEKVCHEFTDKLPISNFPIRMNDNKDAPVVIYEFPVENPPYGLYVAGVDPYRQGQAAYSDSLGSVYIYKRMHNLMDEKFQDMFVASYTARPDKKETWEEQARLLIKYYNARTLCENDDISFIEYMKAKGDSRYLEKQPEWLKEIVPNTTVSRDFGVHRSSDKIRDYLHNCYKRYMEETILIEKDEEGAVIKEILGVTRILDPMLLEETIQYNEEDNFDRLIAAELAIAQAIKMDPIIGRVGGSDDARVKSLYVKSNPSPLFNQSRKLFNKRRNKLFT